MINPIRRSWLLVPLIASAVSISLISAVYAAPRVSVTTKHYSIHGRTAQELRQQMNMHGVKAENGKRYDAHTSWFVKWQFDFSSRGNRCAIRTVKTSAAVAYMLPKWRDETRAPQELRDRWHHYLQALKTHEDGHRDIGVSAATEIEKAIGTMGPETNCRDLEAKANTLGKSILEKFRNKESFYDIRTGHGMTQGATFP